MPVQGQTRRPVALHLLRSFPPMLRSASLELLQDREHARLHPSTWSLPCCFLCWEHFPQISPWSLPHADFLLKCHFLILTPNDCHLSVHPMKMPLFVNHSLSPESALFIFLNPRSWPIYVKIWACFIITCFSH